MFIFFFQAEDGIRDVAVTGVQTCALPISGMDFFGKVELAVVVKNPKTGKSQQVSAAGTSISGVALRKKNIQKHVLEDINNAFGDALRNFLRGQNLRGAITALDVPPDTKAPATTTPPGSDKPIGTPIG